MLFTVVPGYLRVANLITHYRYSANHPLSQRRRRLVTSLKSTRESPTAAKGFTYGQAGVAVLAASRSSGADSSPPASIVTTTSPPVDSSAWQIWVTQAGTGIRKNDSMFGVFQAFQHVTVARYLYLGHFFALYNTFIFVSFLSFLCSTCRHMRPLWTRANGKRAYTCIGLTPRGTRLSGNFSRTISHCRHQKQSQKKCLSDSKPPRTFPCFYIWRFLKMYSFCTANYIFSQVGWESSVKWLG